MERKILNSKLRQLVMDSFKAFEVVDNDSPLEDVRTVSMGLEKELQAIEDWIISDGAKI